MAAIKKLTELVSGLLSSEELQYLKELNEYLVSESGAWALGNEHLDFIAKLLRFSSICVISLTLLWIICLHFRF